MAYFELPCTPEITVTIGGFECQLLDYTLPPTFNSQYGQDSGGGGCWQATVQMPNLDPNFQHASFKRDAPFVLRVGSRVVWSGKLSGIDRAAPWLFTGLGWVQYASDYNSQRLDGGASSTPDDVIARAQSMGYDVRLPPGGFNSLSLVDGDATAALNKMPALLNADATKSGQRWIVDEQRYIRKVSDPTSPSYIIMPSEPVVGVLDADFYTDLSGRFIIGETGDEEDDFDFDDGTYKYATATVQDAGSIALTGGRRREADPIDLRPLGVITRAGAEVNLGDRLPLVAARMGFTNSLKVAWHEVLTLGGVPATLAFLKAGEMFRVFHVVGQDGNWRAGTYADIVMGNVSYTGGQPYIDLDPVGLKARDFATALADAVAPAPAETGKVQDPATGWFRSS